jgi:hypothetical protein
MEAYTSHIQQVTEFMEKLAKRQDELQAQMQARATGQPGQPASGAPARVESMPWHWGVQLTPGEVGTTEPAIQMLDVPTGQLQTVTETCLNAIFNAGPGKWPVVRLVLWTPLSAPAAPGPAPAAQAQAKGATK